LVWGVSVNVIVVLRGAVTVMSEATSGLRKLAEACGADAVIVADASAEGGKPRIP